MEAEGCEWPCGRVGLAVRVCEPLVVVSAGVEAMESLPDEEEAVGRPDEEAEW